MVDPEAGRVFEDVLPLLTTFCATSTGVVAAKAVSGRRGRDTGPMSMSASDIEVLMGELEQLRAEVESYSTTKGHYWYNKGEDWAADQARYDRALLAVARHLGLPAPPNPPQIATVILSKPDRAQLEELIAQVAAASTDSAAGERTRPDPNA